MSIELNRKALLALAVVAMLATAGCSGILGSDGNAGGGGAKLDSVPADAKMVGYVDVDGAIADDSLRSIANTMLEARAENSQYYVGPESVSGMLDQAENGSGLDPAKLNDVTFFTSASTTSDVETSRSAMILTSEFSESELTDAMREEGTEFTEGTYKDVTVYTYGFENANALAVLGDGTFAIGGVSSVESVIDVRAGDADALSGDLQSAFENTRDGYVRYAMDVSEQNIPSAYSRGTQFNVSAFNAVQYVTGSFYASGDEVGMDVQLTSDSESSATRTYDVVNGVLSLYRGTASGELKSTLEKVSLSQDGNTVTVSYTNTAAELEASLEAMYNTDGSSSPASVGTAPVSV